MTRAYFEKHVTEKNLFDILENLEEAIITKTKNGIGFCNKLGFKILNDIFKNETNDQNNVINLKFVNEEGVDESH
jgi:hypothetical protein